MKPAAYQTEMGVPFLFFWQGEKRISVSDFTWGTPEAVNQHTRREWEMSSIETC